MSGHQVIDKRRRDFFMCDNAIIDTYAPILGPYALAVYVAMLRYAGQKDTCFPSLKLLGKQLGMGKNSVVKAIAALKEAKLVTVKHRTDKAGDAASNLYFIRQVVCQTNNPVPETTHGGLPDNPRVGPHANTKHTHFGISANLLYGFERFILQRTPAHR
jgi:Helix-turn-helix domain